MVAITGIEYVIALSIVVVAVYYGFHVVTQAFSPSPTPDALPDVLSNMFLLVVAIELAELLVRDRPSQLLTVVTLVVARKIVLSSEDVNSLILGVLAITVLFGVRILFVRSGIIGPEQPRTTSAPNA